MVKSLFEIKKILREYKKELSRHNVRVTKMVLYGSYAHGHPKAHSDIDVIVVSADLGRFSALQRQELLAKWTMNLDAPLEVLGYTPAELRRSADTIFGQIIRETGKKI